MTELSFLLSLLLEQKLTKPVQLLIKDRIKEIETKPSVRQQNTIVPYVNTAAHAQPQHIPAHMEGEPVVVAQTQAAAQALASRAQAIAQATSGVPEAGRRSPRKF